VLRNPCRSGPPVLRLGFIFTKCETKNQIRFSTEVWNEGEAAAISVAVNINADLLLMDDRKGVIAAQRRNLRVTGTLGVLDLAAEEHLLSFSQAIKRLRETNFRVPETILSSLIRKHHQEIDEES